MHANFSLMRIVEEWEKQGFSGSKRLIPSKKEPYKKRRITAKRKYGQIAPSQR